MTLNMIIRNIYIVKCKHSARSVYTGGGPYGYLCEEGEEESENINEGNDQSESLLAPKETHDPNAEAGGQMGAHASVIPEEKDNVPIEKPVEKRTYKFAKCLLGTLSKDQGDAKARARRSSRLRKKPTKAITTRNRLCNCDCMFDSINL